MGVREITGHNDHPLIDQWLKYVGLDNQAEIKRSKALFDAGKKKSWGGYSYCAAYGISMYKEAADILKIKNPLPKTARCSEFLHIAQKSPYKFKVYTPKMYAYGIYTPQVSDIVIWSHGMGVSIYSNFDGHFGLMLGKKDSNWFLSREANTPPQAGTPLKEIKDPKLLALEREGSKYGGVNDRVRPLGTGSSFAVAAFIVPQ